LYLAKSLTILYLKQVENSIKDFLRDGETIPLEEVKKKLKKKSQS